MDVAGRGWGVAAGGDAAAVAQRGGAALGAVEGPAGAAQVEDLGGAAHHGGHDLGLAGQLADRGHRQWCAGVQVPGAGDPGAQLGQGGDQVEHHPAPPARQPRHPRLRLRVVTRVGVGVVHVGVQGVVEVVVVVGA